MKIYKRFVNALKLMENIKGICDMNNMKWTSECYYDSVANIEKYKIDMEDESPLLDTIDAYDEEMFHFLMCLLI